jgi:hypothetical protein
MWVQQIRRERIWSSQTPGGQKPWMVFDYPTLSAKCQAWFLTISTSTQQCFDD